MGAPPPTDIVPDSHRAAIIAARPAFRALPITVAGRGWHSLALDIGGRFIAKFPDGAEAEAALRREASLLALAGPRLTLPVPNLTLHEGPPLFSLHGKLQGGTLDSAGYARLDETTRRLLADDIARFFTELHAIPPAEARGAGARALETWETGDAALAPVWPLLPERIQDRAFATIGAYRALPRDPLPDVYGHFDAHGWNMAFDHAAGRLRGIFDFADSGIGSPHREFVQLSLIDPDLAARVMANYAATTARKLDARRVFLLVAAQRLSELAGAIETGEGLDLALGFAIDWFEQDRLG